MNRRTLLLSAACLLIPVDARAAMSDEPVRAAIRRYARANLSPLPVATASAGEASAWAALAPLMADLRAVSDHSDQAMRTTIRRALKSDAQAGRFARRDGLTILATHFGLACLAREG